MLTILITGGTGLVGRSLSSALCEKGYRVIILTRKPPKNQLPANMDYALWNVDEQKIDVQAVQKADYIVHLAGAGVMDKKWDEAYRKEIVNSRVKSSALLINTLKNHSNSVKAVISASAIGWYGPDTLDPAINTGFTETDPAEKSFLGETCRLWEESIEPVEALGKRLVKYRIGIVLGNDGGALAEFRKPLNFGIAPILGNGKQMVSWIHITDLCRLFIHAIEDDQLSGSFNAVAPAPVSNKTLNLQLARIIRGRFFIPVYVPVFFLKLMMGQRSIEIIKSTTVSCKKIRDGGFTFLYPSIEAALNDLCKKSLKG